MSKSHNDPAQMFQQILQQLPGGYSDDGTSNTVLLAEDHVPTSTGGTRDRDHPDHAGGYNFAVEISGITATGIATHTDWHLV